MSDMIAGQTGDGGHSGPAQNGFLMPAYPKKLTTAQWSFPNNEPAQKSAGAGQTRILSLKQWRRRDSISKNLSVPAMTAYFAAFSNLSNLC
jgi:hypothetical protein